MSSYLDAIIWYASWPVLIWVSYKFVMLNLKHFTNMEDLKKISSDSVSQ